MRQLKTLPCLVVKKTAETIYVCCDTICDIVTWPWKPVPEPYVRPPIDPEIEAHNLALKEYIQAIWRGDVLAIRKAIEDNPDFLNENHHIFGPVRDGRSDLCVEDAPIHEAVAASQLDSVKLLVELGADIDSTVETYCQCLARSIEFLIHDKTPLYCAVIQGNLEIARFLIESGANINAQADDDSTPLHFAVQMQDKEMIRLLVTNGADQDIKDESGQTPRDMAAGHGDLLSLLDMTTSADR